MAWNWIRRGRAKTNSAADATLRAVTDVVDEFRPYIRADGGDIELLGVDADGTVRVRLKGACAGCPASFMTLQLGLEQRLRERVPVVRTVVNVP